MFCSLFEQCKRGFSGGRDVDVLALKIWIFRDISKAAMPSLSLFNGICFKSREERSGTNFACRLV